jgi:two-component system sensor kinase FixL
MSHDACSVVLHGDVLVCSLANRPTTPEIVFGLRELLREHGVMTILLSVVVSAALIAVLSFSQFRRFQPRHISGAADAGLLSINVLNWQTPESHPEIRPFVPPIERIGEGQSAGISQKPVGGCKFSDSNSALPTQSMGRACVAMLSAARFSRAAVREGARQEAEETGIIIPPGSSAGTGERRHGAPSLGTLELLPVAVLMTDQHARIVSANAVAENLFGYGRDELAGALCDELIPLFQTKFGSIPTAQVRLVPTVMTVSGGLDVVARRKDSTEFPVEVTTNPVLWDDELHTLTVVIDRTERYELQRNRQQLAHLTRVSTLGELAGSLAHELNQPLTAILSNAQAAQRFLATQPINLDEVREILHDLIEDNHRASEVIRKIRVLAKKGEFEAVPLSVASVIEDVSVLVHTDAIVRGIRVFLSIAPNLPAAQGDRVQLQQVVLNLMLNAFDALEFGSAPSPEVTVEARLDGKNMIRVAVRDNGSGIADDKIDKLFVPFYTSKREGLGLGLSISRSIVEMHGGTIWVENNSDAGATFCFTLPVATTPEYACSHRQP